MGIIYCLLKLNRLSPFKFRLRKTHINIYVQIIIYKFCIYMQNINTKFLSSWVLHNFLSKTKQNHNKKKKGKKKKKIRKDDGSGHTLKFFFISVFSNLTIQQRISLRASRNITQGNQLLNRVYLGSLEYAS